MKKSKPLCNRFVTSEEDQKQFILELTNLMNKAGSIGLYETMHKLHEAVKCVGYEVEKILNNKPAKRQRTKKE